MSRFPLYENIESTDSLQSSQDLNWVFTTISSIPNTQEYRVHLEMLYAIILHHDVKLTKGVSLTELPYGSSGLPGGAKGILFKGDKIPRVLLSILSRYLLMYGNASGTEQT